MTNARYANTGFATLRTSVIRQLIWINAPPCQQTKRRPMWAIAPTQTLSEDAAVCG